jgi:hypothetical protein
VFENNTSFKSVYRAAWVKRDFKIAFTFYPIVIFMRLLRQKDLEKPMDIRVRVNSG